MRHLIRNLLLVALLTGCGNSELSTVNAPASKADIAATEITLTQAINLANICLNQKPVAACADSNVRTPMIAAIHKADDAFLQVQADAKAGTPVYLSALNQMVAQLTAMTPVVPTTTPAK